MAGGGKQPGAGRPKGSRNKATTARQAKIAASGKTPLDFMIDHLRDESAPMAERIDCAKAAAPYVHPKLQATTISGGEKPIEVKLDDRELARRIALILSRAVPKAA